MGALSVGYYKAYDAGSYWYATFAAILGVIVSLGFLFLDGRNKELVELGRDALKSVEGAAMPKDDQCQIATKEIKNRCKDGDERPGFRWKSHTAWLRTIEVVLCALFLLASVMAGTKVYQTRISALTEKTGDLTKMPYITQERRAAILAGGNPQDAGELNFAIMVLVDNYLKDKGEIRYSHLNEVVGAMDCAKLELYRRVAAPYEDKKIAENGDVYSSDKKSVATSPSPTASSATTPR